MATSLVAEDLQLIGQAELCKLIGMSRSQIWRLEREGQFPARIHIGKRRIAWRVSDIRAWLAGREDGAIGPMGPRTDGALV
jgi:prophage regulatory protein